ncbi:MAG: glutamyl-tRNA reductase [Elusimicrobiota bacterium]
MHSPSITGLSHKKTGIDLREKLSFSRQDYPCVLRHFELDPAVSEAVVLSTCNRVEIYCLGAGGRTVEAERVVRFLAEYHKVSPAAFAGHVHHYQDEAAIAYLLKVASGLDSMVLGETQILAQLKDAFACAQERESTGKYTNALFQRAFSAAKRIHTTTGISQAKISVPSVAADFAADLFSSFADKTLLQIGSGETGELTMRHFAERGLSRMLLTNRTHKRAVETAAKFGAEAVPFQDFPQHLHKADIIVTALASDAHVIAGEMMEAAMHSRRNRPLVLLDLSVPRAVDPRVAEMENVFLYDIDSLEAVVLQNMEQRQAELSSCLEIVDEETQAFLAQIEEWKAEPLIRDLRDSLEAIRDQEWRRIESRLGKLDARLRDDLEHMTRRITNRFLHSPTTALREEAKDGGGFRLVEMARKLFLPAPKRKP